MTIGIVTGLIKWNPFALFFFIFVGLLSLGKISWSRHGKTLITVDNDYLTITNTFLFKGKPKRFRINEISKLKALKNEKGENYKSRGRISIFGTKYHPESWKEYDTVPTTIRFTYQNREIKIGEGYRSFSAKKIIDKILEYQDNN